MACMLTFVRVIYAIRHRAQVGHTADTGPLSSTRNAFTAVCRTAPATSSLPFRTIEAHSPPLKVEWGMLLCHHTNVRYVHCFFEKGIWL
jgi:hypothetical protein